ncbi:MAG: LysM peptidoglycan-binding domain-containing protein [Thiotrichaceae bacterium]|uniref:LysM peptidoglycan-binding domain-containing protein n=1 Tax=Candidatus Thiocaldithrix dubininis TaxID=3080823 RepID=A0AA95H8J0_9GAMM|nr:MAG: LysM peptidoglycan-binding domain-containing protein [Candidatus Thiocaldithrix dubininis]
MVKQFKLAATASVVAVALTACAPNPYWQNGNYNRGGGSAAVNRNAVTHTHCGKTHAHVLPPQGLAHHHGDGCMAGSASAARPYTAPNTYRPPANTYQPNYQTQYQGAAANTGATTYGYTDYSGGAAASTGGSSTYYDYSKPKAPSSSSNASASYGASSGGSSYYDYTAPNTSGSSSGYYDYSGSSSSTKPSYGSSSSTSVNSNYTGGGTYTVQKGDTVFQVMRNTGVYWKDIIRLNSLQAPDYKLSPGQQLRLK